MAKAEPIPLNIPAGLVKTESPVSQEGRFIDGDHIRFRRGKVEKIGGWDKWLADGEQFSGTARGMHGWLDNDTIAQVAIGTTSHLYTVDTDGALVDVTPIQTSGTLNNPFSTSNGLTTVTVAHTSHGRGVGDTVIFSGASAVGGITVDGTYTVVSVVDANSYTITHGSPAGSTAGPGGGASVAYQYVLTLGVEDAAPGLGWGIGTWSSGTYGTPRSSSPIIVEPRIWHLDNFGELLMSVASGFGMYSWDPNTPSTRAAVVTNAPTSQRGMFVTGERFVTSLGSDGDPLMVKWASQNTVDTWTPTTTNTANSRRLQAGSKIMAGRRLGAGANLIWTDTACYLHQYTGDQFVYSTRIIGENNGLIGALAVVTISGTAYWMSPKAFYMSGGGSPQKIPRQEEIQEYIFDNLSEAQQLKCCAAFFEEQNEVWWFYPHDNDEPNRYVMVCLDDFSWSVGTMARTSYTRLSTGGSRPLMAGTDGYVYEHELGTDADGAALEASVEYAPFDLGEGLQNMECLGYIPDMERQTGSLSITASTWDRYRSGSPYTETLTFDSDDGIVDMRSDGRQIGFEIVSNVIGGDFRFGLPRILVKPKGTRR